MLALAMALMPPAATILRDRVRQLAEEARGPGPALLSVLRDLLAGRAIDLKAAMAAGARPASGPVPDANAEPGDATGLGAGGSVAGTLAAQGRPRQAAIATLLQVAGLPEADIARLLDEDPEAEGQAGAATGAAGAAPDTAPRPSPAQPAHKTSAHKTSAQETAAHETATHKASTHRPPADQAPRGVAALSRDGAARIEALLEVGLDPDGHDLRDGLRLILAAWPSGGAGAWGERGDKPADLRQRRNWQLLLERLLDGGAEGGGQGGGDDGDGGEGATREGLAAALARALARIEPDAAERARALRYLAVRIGYGGDAEPGLRARVQRALGDILAGDRAAADNRDGGPAATPAPGALIVTEYAGIVLLHPFLKPLFARLNLLNAEGRLDRAGLPVALAALRALDGRAGLRGADPMLRLLLGLPDGAPDPEAAVLDDAGRDLVESLLRAVISHWGRLGKTSPDGLRQTFLQRPGTLRLEDDRVRLRVTPGPFDMLLDGLPWGISLVALPWMARPCHVSWRDRDD